VCRKNASSICRHDTHFHVSCGFSMYTSSGYWSKCLIIIFSLLLGETSSHKSSFVHLYIVIYNMLDRVDQLGSHHWLPPLSLKQGNLPRRSHISLKPIKLRSSLFNSWHLYVSPGRHLSLPSESKEEYFFKVSKPLSLSKIMITLSLHAPSKA
jgi:hypothetical protein